jgi:hypothetical protein
MPGGNVGWIFPLPGLIRRTVLLLLLLLLLEGVYGVTSAAPTPATRRNRSSCNLHVAQDMLLPCKLLQALALLEVQKEPGAA